MTGITKRGDSYRFTVQLGLDGNGKQIRKYTTYTPPPNTAPSKAEKLAQAEYVAFANKCKGMKNLRENMRFSELVEIYFNEYAKNELKEVTAYHYKIALDTHVLPVLGNKKLKDIEVSDISAFLTGLDKLKGASTKKVKTILSSVFHFAIRQRYTKENPCVGAIYKKDNESLEDNCLTIAEAQKLMKLTENYSKFNSIIRLLLYTGMRSGECLGLTWDNVDLENGIINIRTTLSQANNHWFLAPPKTKKSRRSIKIDTPAIEILKLHKQMQDKEKTIVGESWEHPEMVYTSASGHYYDRSLLNTQFRRFIKNNEIHKVTVHGLRHTNASIMINSGIDIKAVSENLGHCNIGVTGDTYSHVFAEYKTKVAQTISLVLNQ